MHKTVFKGAATAIATPITAEGVDYKAFEKLVDWQIEEGIDALVVAGTTGESATLTADEHKKIIACAVQRARGRVPVIAGSGTNDTSHALKLTKNACDAGADAVLVVTPYYNKTTQQGIIKTFGVIADASTVPVIVYNVPSRTGLGIKPATYGKLAEHGNISGIKEANGDISAIAETARIVEGKLDIYSGNDDQIIPIMALGGKGVISVLSNIAPKKTHEICARFFEGDTEGALRLQLDMLPLIHALFSETNPIPVKAALARMGYCENYLRLPLVEMSDSGFAALEACMKDAGII